MNCPNRNILLKEDPDTVEFDDGLKLRYNVPNAYPFIYNSFSDVLFVGKGGSIHSNLYHDIKEWFTDNYPNEEEEIIDGLASNIAIARYDEDSYYGRIWTQNKVISFWDDPPHKDVIRIFDELEKHFGSLDGYVIDRGDWGMPIETYLSNDEETKGKTDFDLSKVHLMPAEKKRNTPQLKGARDLRDNLKAQKLGSTPEVRYNFYRRYGMGDSITKKGALLKEDPDTVKFYNGVNLSWEDTGSHPFIYDSWHNALFVGKGGSIHSDLYDDIKEWLLDNNDVGDDEEDIEVAARWMAEDRWNEDTYSGRIWPQNKVISFWEDPPENYAIRIFDELARDFGSLDGYVIDMGDWGLPIDAYLSNDEEKKKKPNFDLAKIHLMPGAEKRDTPQMQAARDAVAQAKAEKLGGTTEAEYNFYRRYGMGDSVQRSGQPLNESPDSLIWTNERGKPEEICYLADDACPFFYDAEKDDLYLYPSNITHYEVIRWVKWLMKKKYPEMSDEECEKRAKQADNRRSTYGYSGRIWKDSKVISFWVTPPINVLEKMVQKFNEQRIKIQDYLIDLYDFADTTTLGDYIENEKETDYSGMTPEPWFDLDIIHNLPAEEKWNTPQLQGARDTRDRKNSEKLGGMPQAKYNFYKNYGLGDSIQRNGQALTESPDHVYGIRNGEPIEASFHDHGSKAFIYDIQSQKFYMGDDRSQHVFLFDWIVDDVMEDHDNWYIEDAEEYVHNLMNRNSDAGISGRIWCDSMIVSFWNIPSINVLRDMVSNCGFNLEDYYIDEGGDNEMRTVGQILKSATTPKTNFDLNTIHNMSAAEKHNTSQLRGARETADKVKAEKLGSTPEVEYNFYRRYGMGDSITRKGALLKEDPDTVDFHDGSELWVGDQYSYPFIYDSRDDIFFLGEERDTHADMYDVVKEALIIYRPDEDEEDIEWEASNMTDRDEASYWYGRIWTQNKVISFWDDPPHKDVIRIFDELEKHFGSLDGYVIDRGDWGMPIEAYLSNDEETKGKTDFDLSKVHLMPAEKKRNTPQLKGARDLRDNLKAQKLGNTPEAEYNFYRRYGMGDGKQTDNAKQINEVDAQNISLQSFVPQDELNPRFWIKGKLNSNVRIKLLQIAYNFMDESKVNWVEPEDVVLTGSIANYNWSKYSDVDVHIILDYNKVWKKTEFVEDYFGDKKELWSNTHPNLKIYGFPVEVYVEDLNTPADSSGIFSLLTNKWLKEPVDFNDSSINGEYVKNYAARIETKIDNIITKMKRERNARKIEDYSKALQAIFNKLKNIRKEGLRKGGEMGSGNIIWKICKRMGYIDKLWNYVNLAYDKTHSIS